MQFTLDGDPFELTPESVRARLDSHVPETIREYWVEIDGTQWPVKQVIAIATGARRTRFQSQDARRWLRKLGFQIGQAAAGGPADTTTSVRPRTPLAATSGFDPSTLEALDTVDVTARFICCEPAKCRWTPRGSPFFLRFQPDPAFTVSTLAQTTRVHVLYVGESMSLRQRASNYRNAKTDRSLQRTSRRIHKELVKHLDGGALSSSPSLFTSS